MALALILLVGAALMIRTFEALRSVKPGFDAHNVLTMEMALSGSRFGKTAGMAQTTRDVEQRVGALPGVEAVAGACCLPLTGGPGFPVSILCPGPVLGGFKRAVLDPHPSPPFFQMFPIPLPPRTGFTA